MPRPPKKATEELIELARLIKSQRGRVTVPLLRQAAGGGSFRRLKDIIGTVETEASEAVEGKQAALARPALRTRGISLDEQVQQDLKNQIQALLSRLEDLLREHNLVLGMLQEDRQMRRIENEALTRLVENQSRLIDQVCRMVDIATKTVQIGMNKPPG